MKQVNYTNIEEINSILALTEVFKMGYNHDFYNYLEKNIVKYSGSDVFNFDFDIQNELLNVYIPVPTDILKDLFTFMSRLYNGINLNLPKERLGIEVCDWYFDKDNIDLCITFKLS